MEYVVEYVDTIPMAAMASAPWAEAWLAAWGAATDQALRWRLPCNSYPYGYTGWAGTNTIIRSSEFDGWLSDLADHKAKARILTKQGHHPREVDGAGAESGEVMTGCAPFEAADHLDSEQVIAEYLSTAADDANPDVFLVALGDVAKARGMAQIAKASGLGRESLYKALSAGAHPRHETISVILRALGVKFAIVADSKSA